MQHKQVHIIMPVKDSVEIAQRAIRAVVASGYSISIYDDNSLPENAHRLDELAAELKIPVYHISDLTDHPSPNYRLILQLAQQHALSHRSHLVIVESDVIVSADTIQRMIVEVTTGVGMVAAVTVDEAGEYNFPYHYIRKYWYRRSVGKTITSSKRMSFCCTLLTYELLELANFRELDPTKNWYDVTISHWSLRLGLQNRLMLGNPVLHLPHSSRPWKRLKYTHPLRYYWRKLMHRMDKI